MNPSIFAEPRTVASIDECRFYHVMDVPGYGTTSGQWDLRGKVDEYLGNVSFADKRVLEIGPASGFLTFEMEKRGADVTCVEITEEAAWDFVPYPEGVLVPARALRRQRARLLANAFWLAHRAHGSKARMHYGHAANLPDGIGTFDIAVMAAVLLHCRDAVGIVEQCARRAKKLIVTEPLYDTIEGTPVARLAPTVENEAWHVWWHFSSAFFVQLFKVMGFSQVNVTTSVHHHVGVGLGTMFTVVGSR